MDKDLIKERIKFETACNLYANLSEGVHNIFKAINKQFGLDEHKGESFKECQADICKANKDTLERLDKL